jgi:hypothetical protein
MFKQKENKEQKNSLLTKRKYLEDKNGAVENTICKYTTSNQEELNINEISLMFSQFISNINQSNQSLIITIRFYSQKEAKIE